MLLIDLPTSSKPFENPKLFTYLQVKYALAVIKFLILFHVLQGDKSLSIRLHNRQRLVLFTQLHLVSVGLFAEQYLFALKIAVTHDNCGFVIAEWAYE